MLVLTRRPGEGLTIEPDGGLDPETSVRELFSEGLVTFRIINVSGNTVRVGVEAPADLLVLREEHLRREE